MKFLNFLPFLKPINKGAQQCNFVLSCHFYGLEEMSCFWGKAIAFIFLLITLLGQTDTRGQCTGVAESDSLALVAFYTTTNGVNWNNNSAWLSAPVAQWYGILLTADGCRVRNISLVNNNLTGTLPNLNLPKLTGLFLHDNQITGSLSDFWGLPDLKYFGMNGNQLDGDIPDFSNLPNLEGLYLSNNQLSGNIPNFSNLPQLIALVLQGNQLSGSIPEFENLENLQDLILYDNLLSGVLPDLSHLTNLNALHVEQNQLNFDGLEQNFLSQINIVVYSPQAAIPIYQNADVLYVIAGGTLCNNTYTWYESNEPDVPVHIGICDSTFAPTENGTYYCQISNAVVNDLVLTSLPFEINSNLAVTATAAAPLTFCAGGQTTLQATASGGQTPYFWDWLLNGESISGVNNNTYTAQMPGTYTVLVTDANGNTSTANIDVIVHSAPLPTIAGNTSLCGVVSTSLNVEGGVFEQYLWQDGSPLSQHIATSAGTYSVTVTDLNGCTASASVLVSNEANFADAGSDQILGCNASVIIGTPPEEGYEYLWSNGSSDAQILVNTPGTYTLIVANENACEALDTVLVEENFLPPLLTIEGNSNLCMGESTVFTASGGVSYLWSTGTSGSTLSLNEEGIYTVTATGANGCTASVNTTLTVSVPPLVELKNDTLTVCSNGSVPLADLLTADSNTGGTWQGMGIQGSAFLAELVQPNAVYALRYSLETGNICGTIEREALVYVKPPLGIVDNSVIEECIDPTHYNVAFGIMGGVPPYTLFDVGSNTTQTCITGNCTWENLSVLQYELQVIDADNCGISISGTAPATCANPCGFTASVAALGEGYACKNGFEVALNSSIDAIYQFACRRINTNDALQWQFDNHFADLEEGLYDVYIKSNLCLVGQWIGIFGVQPMGAAIQTTWSDDGGHLACVTTSGVFVEPLSYEWAGSDLDPEYQTACYPILPNIDTLALLITDKDGCSITLSQVVGGSPSNETDNTGDFEEYTLYPNPYFGIGETLYLERVGNQRPPAVIQILADNGGLMNQYYLPANEWLLPLPVTRYKPGIYLVRINSLGGQWLLKLVVL